MYKIIFSDIDRTIAINGIVSEDNINAINKYILLGNRFILVSGRTINYTSNISKMIGASNFIICNNGSIIYDYINKQVIYENKIKKDTLIKLFNLAMKFDTRCIVGGNDITYTNKIKHKNLEYEISEITDDIYDNNPITQITISHSNKDKMLEIIDFVNEFNDVYISNKSRNLYDNEYKKEDFWIDISSIGTNKGIAIKKLLEYLNINLNESIRIGDDLNDLPMFLEEGLNVCVANAICNVKNKADYVTDSCENNGVAKLINKVIKEEI